MSLDDLRNSNTRALSRRMAQTDRDLRCDAARGYGPVLDTWLACRAAAAEAALEPGTQKEDEA